MNVTKNAIDRVRPILEAMEQSIDAARQRRLSGGTVTNRVPAEPVGTDETTPPDDENVVTRLRARPKRPASVPGYDPNYRSQAG